MDDSLLFRSLKGWTEPQEERLVQAWRAASPENESHWRTLAAILSMTHAAEKAWPPVPAPPIAEVLAVQLDRRTGRGNGRRGWRGTWWPSAAAAAMLLIVGGSAYLATRGSWFSAATDELVTRSGETRSITLGDGTLIRLAPASRLVVPRGDHPRQATLAGRAYFAVAKDPRHPFRIMTEAGELTVLGTRFDLLARGNNLRVVVVEGRVEVSTSTGRTEVGAGESSEIRDGVEAAVVKVPDLSPFISWSGHLLTFQSAPLGAAATEIEREYGVRVRVADSTTAHRTVTISLADWPLEDAVQALCAVAGVPCSVTDSVVMLGR